MKKDFTTANTGRVYSTITEATAQEARKEYTEQEVQQMRLAGTTQGRKGCKSPRINMAFNSDIHEYIKTMARVRGETATDFVNTILRQHMEANAEIYEKAQAFQKIL